MGTEASCGDAGDVEVIDQTCSAVLCPKVEPLPLACVSAEAGQAVAEYEQSLKIEGWLDIAKLPEDS